MITYNETVNEAYEAVLDSIKWELEDIISSKKEREIYFHDLIHENLDNIVSSNNRADNLEAIDDTGNENDIDEGMVDRNADISMQIAQIAYCCVETELFNDDFMQELQTALNNETVSIPDAKRLLKKVNAQLKD